MYPIAKRGEIDDPDKYVIFVDLKEPNTLGKYTLLKGIDGSPHGWVSCAPKKFLQWTKG